MQQHVKSLATEKTALQLLRLNGGIEILLKARLCIDHHLLDTIAWLGQVGWVQSAGSNLLDLIDWIKSTGFSRLDPIT